MRKIYLAFLLTVSFNLLHAQGENCSGAVSLTNGMCVSGTAGLTQNIAGCVGNADDDAWYKFVATGTSHSITVTGSASYDAVLQFFSGTCSSLISGGCVDNSFNGQAESMVASGLTVGNTYYVRVYHYFAGSGSSTFTICLNNPPPAPSNDICGNAISLAVNAVCVNTSGTTFGATQSYAGCAGTANDDVWYSFTATNYTQTIQVAGSAAMDPVIELYSGSCASLSSMSCTDNTFSGGTETATASGLTPGQTYFFRVYDYYSAAGNTFSVCVSGTSIIAGSQPNDEPCNAIQIPAVTADCNNLTFSNIGATATILPGTPPATCENYNNSTNTMGALSAGGFTTTTKDVWFKITIPASGNIYITPTPNQGAGWIQDGVMMLYRGTCGALTSYTCSDDYNYPAGYNDLQPFVRATGLTPGETVYLRYWGYGSEQGNFGFCVQSPTNDLCANALYICDINGYSATTSPAYDRDHPCNMRGNGEGPGPTYTYSVNANPAGPFGAGGTWGTGSTVNDVYIDNNSWVRFTAASPTVSLRVTVYDCWGIGTNSITGTPGTPRGVQMQIFSSSSACCGFTPVSDYKENASGSFSGGISTYTVTANSLTIGNDYYVMVDGWSGDICNYNIQAISGVSLPAITAVPGTICPGNSSILTAPSGATGYTWEPTGETTQTISVSPGTQMTYTCYVGGVCGYKQTLTKTVFLYTTPTVAINSGAAIVNCGTQTTTLTGSGASTYSWSTGSTATSFTVAPTASQSYSVIGTSVNGCTNTAVTNVTVNTVPSLTVASSSNTICTGSGTTLSVSGANTYVWSPAGSLSASTGTAVTASPTVSTNYSIIGTAANGCTNSATYSVTVNPKPTVSSTASNSVVCSSGSTTLNGTGASTYTWSGGVTDGVAFTPTVTATYTVTGTNAVTGCTNSAVRTITVNTTPTVSASSSNSVVCFGQSTTLSGSGANTYTWTGGITNGAAFTPTSTSSYTVIGTAVNGCTNSAVRTITVNSLPVVGSTASSATLCNGSSVTLNGTGANSYTWTGGVTNGVAFVPPAGVNSYTVIGADANTCTNTAVRTVTVNTIPVSATSTSGSITCVTNTVNLNSSLAGQNYTWTAPAGSSVSGGTANNQNAIGQGPGTYTLHVMSSAGCSYSTTLAANINTTAPTSSASGGTLTCSQTSVVLNGGPANGVTYNWSGPGISGNTTGANATATVVGNYSLVTTSTLTGCASTAAAVATVTNNLTTPTVSAGSNQVITCAAPSVTLSGSSSGGALLNWSNGSTTNTTTVGGAGIYTLTATHPVTGCSATSTVEVLPSAGTPTGAVGAVTGSITCSNTSLTISVNSGISPLTYSWTGPGSIASPTSSATSVSSGGTYTVTITNTASCSQSYPVVVPTNTTPVTAGASLAVSGSSITCTTNSLSLNATPTGIPYVYSWSGPAILSGSNTANPVVGSGGNYTVTVTNSVTGCSGVSGTTNVSVPTNTAFPTLNLSASSITTTCGNPTTTVTASSNADPDATYSWNAPASGTISNAAANSPTLGGSGIFTVVATNTVNGCSSSVGTVSVSADTNTPTFTLSDNSVTITCFVPTPSVTLTSTVSNLTYSWTPPPASGANIASATFTAAGNYTCIITNTVNNCSTNIPVVSVVTDTVVPAVTVTAPASITCASTTVNVSASSVPSAVTYTWSGNGILGSANNSSITVNAPGVFSVSVTDTGNGCANNTVTVEVGTNTLTPALSVNATQTVLTCSQNSSTLTANPSGAVWTLPGGNTSANPLTVSTAGDYTVTATDGVNGCLTTSVITINNSSVLPDANAGATVSMPCNSSSTTLNGTSSTTDPVTFEWAGPDAGSISSATNIASPTVTMPGTYTLTVTNLSNGCVATSTVQVTLDNVVAGFNADPIIGEIPLTVTFTNTSVGATSYIWNFGNGSTSTFTNSSTVYTSEGTYTVTLIAYSGACSDTIRKTIVAEHGFSIEIPNVFTPNGDGANDAFHIKTSGVKSAEGFIYNRWGQLLHSWDALNTSWDGKASNGEDCPDATYYYLIKVIDKKGKEHVAPGYVLIIR
jgi:gliding motility-associated-like protein